MLELAFRPDRTRRVPVYRQLADYLRALVESGHLVAGQKLPATRELAVSLGLSRTTANLAYDSLAEAGLVSAHVGQGTFVSARRSGPGETHLGNTPAAAGIAWEGLFAREGRPAPLTWRPEAAAAHFDFRPGRVDPEVLPAAELRRAFARVLSEHAGELANRLDPQGWPPLRHEIARALVSRGIACEPDDVLVVGGSQQALDLLARVLLDPGDAVVLEQPGYVGAAVVFGARGVHRVGCGVDAEGLCTDELARILRGRRVKLVYTTPAVQSPTGVAMSDARRSALLELAATHQMPVIEDDYDSELRLEGPARPSLKNADATGRVIYLGTFSKALFPALRVGYVVAARPLLARLAEVHMVAGFGSSALTQAALAELLASGGLERHVRRVRRRYAERLETLLEAFDAAMPSGARCTRPAGGSAVWATLPPGTDSEAVHSAARAAGIGYLPGDVCRLDGQGAEHLALGFAKLPPERIQEGIAQLGEIVRQHSPRRSPAARTQRTTTGMHPAGRARRMRGKS